MRNVLVWHGVCALNLDAEYYTDCRYFKEERQSAGGSWTVRLQDPLTAHDIRARSTILRFGEHPKTFKMVGGTAYVKVIRRGPDQLFILEEAEKGVEPKGTMELVQTTTDLMHYRAPVKGLYLDLSSGGCLSGTSTILAVLSPSTPLVCYDCRLEDPTVGAKSKTWGFVDGVQTMTTELLRDSEDNRLLLLPKIKGSPWSIRPQPRHTETIGKFTGAWVEKGVYTIRLRTNRTTLIGRELAVT